MILAVQISFIIMFLYISGYVYSKTIIMKTKALEERYNDLNDYCVECSEYIDKKGENITDPMGIRLLNKFELLALCYYDGRFYNKKLTLEMTYPLIIDYYENEYLNNLIMSCRKDGDENLYEYFTKMYNDSKKYDKKVNGIKK